MSRSSWLAEWSPHTEWWSVVDEETGALVATAYESEENAHKIAAVPDLLEAAEKALACEGIYYECIHDPSCERVLEAAIAKAKGESHGSA